MDPATLSAIDALTKLGAVGILLAGFGLVLSGKLRTEREAKQRDLDADARLGEMRTDRDEWKGLAKDAIRRLDRLTDVVERITGTKVPD